MSGVRMLGVTTPISGGPTSGSPISGSRVDDVARATQDARWVRRWDGWAQWQLTPGVLVLALTAVIVDVVTAWAGWSLGHLGRIQISPALPLAVLLAARIGVAALGCSRVTLIQWREFAFGTAVIVPIVVDRYLEGAGGRADVVGLVVAAAGEELVYRFAVLLIVGALAAHLAGRDWRRPRDWGPGPGVAALLAAGVVFSLLPGHVAQMHGPFGTLPFASLSIVLGWVVLRTGALWPVVAAHAVLNFTAFGSYAGGISADVRIGISLTMLIGLMAAADLAGRRAGRLRTVPTTIDLTAIVPPS